MTTEQTNSDPNGTPKKPRKGSKAAIDAEMAQLTPSESSAPSAADEPAPVKAITWNDVVAASAERDASEWQWDEAEEIIPVKLTDADKARLLDENAVDQKEKDEVDTKIESHKDKIKSLKAEADVIIARTEGRNRSCGEGIEQRRAIYKIGTCFALNSVRYVDRETGVVLYERAIQAHERQISLPLVSSESADKAAQMSLGDVEPIDDTAMTDPEALLRTAQDGDGDPADVPLANEPSLSDLGDEDHDEDDVDGDDDL